MVSLNLVKSPNSPFDKLKSNGMLLENIDFFPFDGAHDRPFIVSLSKRIKDFLRLHQIYHIHKPQQDDIWGTIISREKIISLLHTAHKAG